MSASITMSESGSSGESEDEEETKRLTEASIIGFIGAASSSSNAPDTKNGPKDESLPTTAKAKPSLRYSAEDEVDKLNSDLKTTPEVRAFIAKKLSQALDQSIELLDSKDVRGKYKKSNNKEDEGFKLFSRKTQQQLDKKLEAKQRRQEELRQKRRKKESSSDSSEEDARLAEAAVSADFVLQHSGVNSRAVPVDTTGREQLKNRISETKNSSPCVDKCSTSLSVSPDSGLGEQINHKHELKRKKQKQKEEELRKSNDFSDGRVNTEISAKKKKKKCKHRHSESTNS